MARAVRSAIGKALTLFRSDRVVLNSLIGSFGLKAMTVGLNFGLVALLATSLPAQDFGAFSMLFSAAGLFAIVAIAGQQVLLMRKWSELSGHDQLFRLKGALLFGAAAIAAGLTTVGGAFLLALLLLGVPLLLALAATAYLTSLGLTTVSAHLVRSAIGIFMADAMVALGTMLPPLAYLAGHWTLNWPATVGIVLWLMAGGGFVTFALHLFLVRRSIRRKFPHFDTTRAQVDASGLAGTSLRLWGSQILEVCHQYLDVLIVGLLLHPTAAGDYFVITRLANVFATLSAAIYVSTTRHLPGMYYAGEKNAMSTLLDTTAIAAALAVGAGMLVVLAGGDKLLFLFGDSGHHHYELMLLSLGTALLAMTGPAVALLNISGHEGSYFRLLAVGLGVRLAGFVLLVPGLGLTGAVMASAISMLWLGARTRQVGINLTGMDGSVFRLLRLARQGRGMVQAPPGGG